MLFGEFGKKFGSMNNPKVLSESDAIIEYMMNEAKQYENILLTESFFDEEERLVMEANIKYYKKLYLVH